MRVKGSVEIGSSRYGTDADELLKAAARIPGNAKNIKHSIIHNAGDRPWEGETFSILIEWVVDD